MKGINIDERIEVTLPSDTDEVKSVFVLKPLTGFEMLTLGENFTSEEYLSRSVIEIKNYDCMRGSILETLSTLPPRFLGELLIEVNKINHLDDDSKKK